MPRCFPNPNQSLSSDSFFSLSCCVPNNPSAAMWLHLVLRGGLSLFGLHNGRPLRLLGLLAVANSSMLTMIYFTHGARGLQPPPQPQQPQQPQPQQTPRRSVCVVKGMCMEGPPAERASGLCLLSKTGCPLHSYPATPFHAGRMSLPAMRRLLPLLALQPVRRMRGKAVCGSCSECCARGTCTALPEARPSLVPCSLQGACRCAAACWQRKAQLRPSACCITGWRLHSEWGELHLSCLCCAGRAWDRFAAQHAAACLMWY